MLESCANCFICMSAFHSRLHNRFNSGPSCLRYQSFSQGALLKNELLWNRYTKLRNFGGKKKKPDSKIGSPRIHEKALRGARCIRYAFHDTSPSERTECKLRRVESLGSNSTVMDWSQACYCKRHLWKHQQGEAIGAQTHQNTRKNRHHLRLLTSPAKICSHCKNDKPQLIATLTLTLKFDLSPSFSLKSWTTARSPAKTSRMIPLVQMEILLFLLGLRKR